MAATNNVPVKISDVVDGGRHGELVRQGVNVGTHTRSGRVSVSLPKLEPDGTQRVDASGKRQWDDSEDVVEGIVLLRKGEKSQPALADVEKKVEELRKPGELLPGTTMDTIYDRSELIQRTTHTVRENVLVGIGLVVLILLIFLNDVRSALIVALNIPLALLFAFSTLYLLGKSTNLLSLGAVDFGIIVDSSVIMVEAIYRRLSSGEDSDLPLDGRILKSSSEVERSLFFSRVIIICALLPLFTMSGPEGQIFGPMAEAYAFALAGALVFALMLSPVLCRLTMRKIRNAHDNFLVRGLKRFYMLQLELGLRYRWAVLGSFAALIVVTGAALPFLGREFMPALEEGNVYIRGTFPVKVRAGGSRPAVADRAAILREFPEVRVVLSQSGRPDDGTDPTGFYNSEFLVPLKHEEDWPKVVERRGWGKRFGPRARTQGRIGRSHAARAR